MNIYIIIYFAISVSILGMMATLSAMSMNSGISVRRIKPNNLKLISYGYFMLLLSPLVAMVLIIKRIIQKITN